MPRHMDLVSFEMSYVMSAIFMRLSREDPGTMPNNKRWSQARLSTEISKDTQSATKPSPTSPLAEVS